MLFGLLIKFQQSLLRFRAVVLLGKEYYWRCDCKKEAGICMNGLAGKIIDYCDRFHLCIDARGTGDEKAMRGAFLTVVRKEALTMLRKFFYIRLVHVELV